MRINIKDGLKLEGAMPSLPNQMMVPKIILMSSAKSDGIAFQAFHNKVGYSKS